MAAPAQVPPGGGEAARVFSAALRQEDAGTGVLVSHSLPCVAAMKTNSDMLFNAMTVGTSSGPSALIVLCPQIRIGTAGAALGAGAVSAAALGSGGRAAEPASPPAALRLDTSPEHSPVKPHSGRSPTPLIVDQLLSDMMEDAFTPR